jgi:hypothetical protein
VKVIEGEYRVLSEDGVPVRKRKPLWLRVVRYIVTRPVFWLWVFMLTDVGLTEGLW